ncbi:hypothetical protein [Demequina muriae]|uniref:PQQ-like domain-containing protein n=1 Tax=Demequina muriae TaxID=3051664 RepID=A0ABT8GGS7_9MICO|nr:hypothetical protein [Demequina sp. EGI L300058]MDN4480469.1 hypothetical protein [Demequina sp. EGI L300058]
MSTTAHTARAATLAGGAALALLLSACAADPGTAASASSSAAPGATQDAHDDPHDGEGAATQQSSATPRLAVTYDGGVAVIDAATLELVSELELGGFNRINAAGDGRHVAVATNGGWAVLDAGTWSEAHGDHAHYYTAAPVLHEVLVEAELPAHVVVHDGLTSLFDDGTGDVTVVETGEWTEMVEHGDVHAWREYATGAAHHGVAAAAADGTMLVTEGTEDDGVSSVGILDAEDEVIVSSDECPGLHGETAFTGASGDEYMMTGCHDGALVFHGDHAHKIAAPDEFGRIGNAFSFDGSDIVLGDYKTDPEGGIGLTQATLIDVESESITVIDPFDGADAQYTWRGLARGAEGEALALGTDGALRVIDPATGDVVRSIDVIDGWEVPEEWQTAHPALTVLEGMAYVTDPANGAIHAVDYVSGEVWKSAEIGVEINEIVGVTG